jgi:hypothetical protein
LTKSFATDSSLHLSSQLLRSASRQEAANDVPSVPVHLEALPAD